MTTLGKDVVRIEELRKGLADLTERGTAREKTLGELRQQLFEAGRMAGGLHKALDLQGERISEALVELEQAHQAIHDRQANHALHCIARAMQALAEAKDRN